jgi:L-lactate dehydrogenase complex protein LldG
MTSSREEILGSLRLAQQAPAPLPGLDGIGVRYPDPVAQFAKSLAEVGGRCVVVADGAALSRELTRLPEYAAARKVVSLVPGIGRSDVDLLALPQPHDLHDLDFCVLPGMLGVAENGAVWVSERGSRNRAAWFLAQHVALVLPAAALVHNLHQAYERLDVGGPGFAMFISGPSKTADIEQALVIGAQGPRSCTVFLLQ